ncbi:MAG TPA: hypothetical protein VMM82_10240 [Spirochaetia bacterium]|nr:hypothetical protein [Spirochaetia bacterium]
MCDRIQQCASQVISLLQEKGLVNVLLFPQLLGERSHVAYQALGWLAREGSVQYSMKGRQCYVSLCSGSRADGAGEGGDQNAVTE